jgi:hypothetical protein
VRAAFGEQLVMGAAFDYSAAVDDEYLVGALNGGQTVCDDETCATLHQLEDGLLYLQFGPGVHARCGLVEYQYGGVRQHCAGDADELALSLA